MPGGTYVGKSGRHPGLWLKAHKKVILIVLIVVVLLASIGGVVYWKYGRQQATDHSPLSQKDQDVIAAQSLAVAGSTQEAQKAADKLISGATTNTERLNYTMQKADGCFRAADYACAKTAYEQTLEIEADNLASWLRLAEIAVTSKDTATAKQYITKAEAKVAGLEDPAKSIVSQNIQSLKQRAGL